MSYEDYFIKVSASIPGLKDKVHVDIKNLGDKIYWYIKFNLTLDAESVSNQNMNVTDTQGFLLDTEITYSTKKNLIVINPLEDYLQNHYYLLNISTAVRSENLNNLKNDIHILFKLKGRKVSEFKILPANVRVPEPRRRPAKKSVADKPTNSRVYSFEKYIDKESLGDKLPIADITLNPLIGAAGLIMTIVSMIFGKPLIIGACGAVALIGVVHIVIQLLRKDQRSNFIYNRGVRKFNRDKFDKAEKCFNKALEINPDNEFAEYAKNKISYF